LDRIREAEGVGLLAFDPPDAALLVPEQQVEVAVAIEVHGAGGQMPGVDGLAKGAVGHGAQEAAGLQAALAAVEVEVGPGAEQQVEHAVAVEIGEFGRDLLAGGPRWW